MFTILATAFLLADLVNGYARIVNGTDTTLSKHPHQVALEYASGSHKCGGSIIASQWVLTAAHCVGSEPSSDRISLNNGDRNIRQPYGISRVIVHPDYNKGQGAFPNDIALIKTDQPMNFEIFGHSTIGLADDGENFDGETCTITGWGRISGGGSLSSILQETHGEIMTSSECAGRWGTNYRDAVHICIDNTYSGACNGDSGGPMICRGRLAGVTSWGRSGCDTTFPSVYARVSNYIGWIEATIGSN